MYAFALLAVHRLNVELSRYQAKYRPVSFEVNEHVLNLKILALFLDSCDCVSELTLLCSFQEVEGVALPYKNEVAPWLVGRTITVPWRKGDCEIFYQSNYPWIFLSFIIVSVFVSTLSFLKIIKGELQWEKMHKKTLKLQPSTNLQHVRPRS